MAIRAELVLLLVGLSLAIVAITSVLPHRFARWRTPIAAAACAMAGLLPILLQPFLAPEGTRGSALWEWSAVGGPTVQASYRLDGLAAAGLAIGALYVGASLVATTRVPARATLLRPALLLDALILITLVVTDDLIAAIVVLGALAAGTIFVALLVSPAASVARVTAYLAAGVQSLVLAGLLITRSGVASFRFDAIPAVAMTPGAILAATIGAALCAGLYPFVPWGYRQDESGERESLRGLLTTPIAIGATVVLIRVVGVTRIDLATVALPGTVPPILVVLAAVLLALAAWRYWRTRSGRRRVALSGIVLGFLLLYPYLHWSHLVVAAALLTVMYAAAVSLTQPEQWSVTRYDVVVAASWIGIAVGTPGSLAAAIVVLAGGGLAALAEAFWMPPHRGYIAMLTSTTTIIAAALAVAVGAVDSPDPVTVALSVVAVAAVVALELVHVGRRLQAASAPPDLEITGTLFAFLAAAFVAILFAAPLEDTLEHAFARSLDHDLTSIVYASAMVGVVATMLAVAAGGVRPLLPDTAPIGARLARVVGIADPVPLAVASFSVLARSATVVSAGFALFERRAGVWLALVLIVGVLFWSAR